MKQQIEFAAYQSEIKSALQGLKALSLELKDVEASAAIDGVVRSFEERESKLNLVLVGAYSSGKTSLINSLIGLNLPTGAGVVTAEVSDHDWNGIHVVDTPGVRSQLEKTHHDLLSEAAIQNADLILFVVTPDLFEPPVANYLQRIVTDGLLPDGITQGLGLHRKTAVVINKMDMVLDGEDGERTRNIVGAVRDVLDSAIDVPVFLCSVDGYVGSDGDEADEDFLQFQQLITHINDFVRDRGVVGKLQTPLQRAASIADEMVGRLQSSAAKEKVEEMTGLLTILKNARKEFSNVIIGPGQEAAYNTVVSAGNNLANRIVAGISKEDMDQLTEEAISEGEIALRPVYDSFKNKTQATFEAAIERLRSYPLDEGLLDALHEIAPSHFSKSELETGKLGWNFAPAVRDLGKAALNTVGEILENGAKDTKALKEFIRSISKTKFPPWGLGKEAAKWAQKMGAASKALPFVAAALDLWANYSQEQQEAAKERHFASCRTAFRQFVAGVGQQARTSFRETFESVWDQTMGQMKSDLEKTINTWECQHSENTAAAERIQTHRDALRELMRKVGEG